MILNCLSVEYLILFTYKLKFNLLICVVKKVEDELELLSLL